MKSTLFASTLATALTVKSFGEVNVYHQGSCCGSWAITWDLPEQRLNFFTGLNYGYTVWVFDVSEETTVNFEAEWLTDTGGPPRIEGPGSFEFAPISTAFSGVNSWSGTFDLAPGSYLVTFYEFEGTLIFGDTCSSDNDADGDGVCDDFDGCPEDANKSGPGNCGCGVPETDVFGDLDCDGDYDVDDIRLGMTTFGIEEAEEDTCPADVDGDGSIGFSDVLIILNDWGACP